MAHKMVKPAEGRLVRDPKSMQLVSAEGVTIRISSFWNRRIKDGDVFVSDEVVETSTSNPKPKK